MSKLHWQAGDQVLGMKEDNDANVEAVLLTDDSEADQNLEILLYIFPIFVYYLWFLAYHHLFLKNVDRDAKKKHKVMNLATMKAGETILLFFLKNLT